MAYSAPGRSWGASTMIYQNPGSVVTYTVIDDTKPGLVLAISYEYHHERSIRPCRTQCKCLIKGYNSIFFSTSPQGYRISMLYQLSSNLAKPGTATNMQLNQLVFMICSTILGKANTQTKPKNQVGFAGQSL